MTDIPASNADEDYYVVAQRSDRGMGLLMDGPEIAALWSEKRFVRFSSDYVDSLGIDASSSAWLKTYGLPREVKPLIVFDTKKGRLETVRDWSTNQGIDLPQATLTWLRLGKWMEAHFCVDAPGTGRVMTLVPAEGYHDVCNESLYQYIQCLAAYSRMSSLLRTLSPREQQKSALEFEASLREIDPNTLRGGWTWWQMIVEENWMQVEPGD